MIDARSEIGYHEPSPSVCDFGQQAKASRRVGTHFKELNENKKSPSRELREGPNNQQEEIGFV